MILLTSEEIICIHEALIKRTGGSFGLRDRGLLESAVSSTETAFEDYEKYPTIEEKCARLAYALISNHAFSDGNKRVGIAAMLVTLRINKVDLKYTQEELIELGLSVASGKSEYEEILKWIKKRKI